MLNRRSGRAATFRSYYEVQHNSRHADHDGEYITTITPPMVLLASMALMAR
jgi:hypothetical protein